MGERGSFAVVKDGQTQLYRSQWGGMQVVRAFFFGPDSARSYSESLDPVDYLLDSTWCEGAAVLDLDARSLLFYQEDSRYYPEIRFYLLALMKFNWPGWDIRWANGDIIEIALHLGIDPTLVRTIEDGDIYEEPPDWNSPPDFVGSVLTVVGSGTIADYGFEIGVTNLLSQGPALFDRLNGREYLHLQFSELEDLECGTLIDRDRLEIDLWFQGVMDQERVERLRRRWPGWTLRRHEDGLPGHLARSGRDPEIARIVEESALQLIEKLILETTDFDPGKFLEGLRSKGEVIHYVAPGFLRTDNPGGETEVKRSAFSRALSEYRKNRMDLPS